MREQGQLVHALFWDSSSSVPAFIRGDEKKTAQERLEIYRYAVWERMIASLRDDFPESHALIAASKSDFDDLSREYLLAYPSRYSSLAELGRDLFTFVQHSPHWMQIEGLAEAVARDWVQYWARTVDRPPSIAVRWGECGPSSVLILNPTINFLGGWLGYRNDVGVQCEAVSESERRALLELKSGPMSIEVASVALGKRLGEAGLAAFMERAVACQWIEGFTNSGL